MSFLKKLAGALVEMPEGEVSAEGVSDEELAAFLKTSGVEDLAGAPAPAAPTAPQRTPLDWSLAEVFKAGGVSEGRNSASTVLTLLAGLQAIPEAQRLVAVRAMDQADDGWDEATVVLDAQKRMQVLQHYLGHIDKDEAARIAAVEAAASAEQSALQTEVSSLEQQIAALQKQRDEAQAAIAASKAHAEDGAVAVKLKANNKRQEVLSVAEKFKSLVTFFST